MKTERAHWSVHVATDDPTGSLPDALRALEAARPAPDVVIVVDNAPAGRPRPETSWPAIRWLRHPRPQPHGRCHNRAIELAYASRDDRSPTDAFALVITPDVIVGTDLFARLDRVFADAGDLAVAGPVLRRAHVTGSLDGERRELEFTDVIDSAGVASGWFGRTKTLARGVAFGDLTRARPPLGPPTSCFALRLSALRVMSPRGPWFDESGAWDTSAIRLYRALGAAGFSSRTVDHAVAWRLAARAGLR